MKIFKILLRVFLWSFLVLVLFLALASGMYFSALVDFVWALLSGWFFFLQRTIPIVRPSWDAILSVLVFSILILGLSHQFCRWLVRHRAIPDDNTTPPAWKLRWTLIAFASLWLIFLNVMGATGMAHQIGWLIGSDDRLLKENYSRSSMDLMMIAKQVEMMAGYATWNATSLRKIMAGADPDYPIGDWMKKRRSHQFTIVPGENGKVAGVIFYSSDSRNRDRDGFRIVEEHREGLWKRYPWRDLPGTLLRLKQPQQPNTMPVRVTPQ